MLSRTALMKRPRLYPAVACGFAASLVMLATIGCENPDPVPSPAPLTDKPTELPSGTTPDGTPARAIPPLPSEGILIPAELTREDLTDGWIALFDGHTLFGWVSESGNFEVHEDAVRVSGGDEAKLRSNTPLPHGTARLQYALPADTAAQVAVTYPSGEGQHTHSSGLGRDPGAANPGGWTGVAYELGTEGFATEFDSPTIHGGISGGGLPPTVDFLLTGGNGTQFRHIRFRPDVALLPLEPFPARPRLRVRSHPRKRHPPPDRRPRLPRLRRHLRRLRPPVRSPPARRRFELRHLLPGDGADRSRPPPTATKSNCRTRSRTAIAPTRTITATGSAPAGSSVGSRLGTSTPTTGSGSP